ncbi:MAG: serine hydrolase [Pseudomonadota bacterium]
MQESLQISPRKRLGRRIVLVAIPCFAAIILIALVFAPFLPRLLREGAPQTRWPANGHHVVVKGTIDASASSATIVPDVLQRSKALFDERGGHALLIWQGGELRGQHFAAGADAGTRFNSFSMVKSLVGALVLRARADGLIGDLEDPIGDYLPTLGDAALRQVPIAQFLTMRSGVALEAVDPKSEQESELKPVETYEFNPFGPLARLHMNGLQALEADLRSDPSAVGQYNYQNVYTAVLGELVATVYNQPLEGVLSKLIWRPSGAGDAHWRVSGQGQPVTAYCCLYATPGDWVKVGVYLMQNGLAEAPFLPQDLWDDYFGKTLTNDQRSAGHYGYHVFHNVLDRQGEGLQGPFTYMMGRGGQMTYMMPDKDLVVVRFGDGYPLLHSTLYGASDTFQ